MSLIILFYFMFSDRNKYLLFVFLGVGFLVYSFQIYYSLPVSQASISQAADNGKMLWQKNNCVSCHQTYGLGGYLGPDLTNVYSKKGTIYISAILKAGTNIMPNLNLTDMEIDDLIAYLKEIDQSGKADPRTFTINKNGTIQQ